MPVLQYVDTRTTVVILHQNVQGEGSQIGQRTCPQKLLKNDESSRDSRAAQVAINSIYAVNVYQMEILSFTDVPIHRDCIH